MRKYTVWAHGIIFSVRDLEGFIVVRFPVTLFPLNASLPTVTWRVGTGVQLEMSPEARHVRHAVFCNLHDWRPNCFSAVRLPTHVSSEFN